MQTVYNLLTNEKFSRKISDLAHDSVWNGRGTDEGSQTLRELATNIINDGQEQPLVVLRIPDDIHLITNQYERETWERIRANNPTATDFVVSGNRRYLAMKLAHASQMVSSEPELVCEYRSSIVDLATARIRNISENAPEKSGQRQLTAFQRSSLVMKMLTLEKLSQKDVAESFGKSQGWVSQVKKFGQNLCDEGWKALELGYLNEAAAKELSEMPAPEQRKALADKVFTTSEIKGRKNEIATQAAIIDNPPSPSVDDVITDAEDAISGNSSGESRGSGSIGLKASKAFCQWVESLEAVNSINKCPEVAILHAVRLYFHANTSGDLIKDLNKILGRTGRYANLGEHGSMNQPGKKTNGAAS